MTIVNGKKEGPATIYDWNKDLKMEVIYENSLYNGPFTVYTDLSKETLFKTCSGFYIDHKLHDFFVQYRRDGTAHALLYDMGKLVGE